MNYTDYEVQDFLKDESFVAWVKRNDPDLNDFWEKWLANNPEKAAILEEAAQIIRSTHYDSVHQLTSQEYIMLYENVLRKSDLNYNKEERRKTVPIGLIAAASIILSVLVLVGIWRSPGLNERKSVVVYESVIKEKKTSNGQKLSFKLPDGTKVILNAASTISYSVPFMRENREVKLEGEAFFDVVEDRKKPFTVITSNFSATVLGTSFNVFAYQNETEHTLSLLTGKVKVESPYASNDGPQILEPGHQIKFDIESNNFSRQTFNPQLITGWKDGIITFKDADFAKVISTLERWYGVEIAIINENKMKERQFSGTFEKKSLEHVLQVLSFSGGFSFSIKDKAVIIEFSD
ncbi:DUF4974 domain-containing protein [Fulvivirga sp. M361]|uniref:FecR family protein n=1 Tax=Fulvivirga sp. M361 TaxID=2594266 RepID=UPI001179FCF5|nr:FecR domain-containing protein [Fulvivirga sp. M361]TRX61717.1 DUF4974 domain-containing protein [Fulvivirga sp. M361]